MKYVVANTFGSAGCDGSVVGVTSISTDKCFYAKDECLNNPDLKPECEFLASQSLDEDLSFIAECKNGVLSALAYKGRGCSTNGNASKAFNDGEPLTIPSKVCLANVLFKY
jgi:hypothetical protein